MNLSAPPSPYSDLATVIRALRGDVGGWGLRGLLRQALVMLVYHRLGGIGWRIGRLCERFQAGKLWRVTGRARVGARVAVLGEAAGPRLVAAEAVLPRRFGWLVRAVGYQAAGYGSQLRTILGQPEMVALLEASPEAGRILRPLCRMLAVETSLLRPGVAVAEVVVAEVVVRARVRRVRVVVDWGRIPLPRGVLSAARRQGFGKVPRD